MRGGEVEHQFIVAEGEEEGKDWGMGVRRGRSRSRDKWKRECKLRTQENSVHGKQKTVAPMLTVFQRLSWNPLELCHALLWLLNVFHLCPVLNVFCALGVLGNGSCLCYNLMFPINGNEHPTKSFNLFTSAAVICFSHIEAFTVKLISKAQPFHFFFFLQNVITAFLPFFLFACHVDGKRSSCISLLCEITWTWC